MHSKIRSDVSSHMESHSFEKFKPFYRLSGLVPQMRLH